MNTVEADIILMVEYTLTLWLEVIDDSQEIDTRSLGD